MVVRALPGESIALNGTALPLSDACAVARHVHAIEPEMRVEQRLPRHSPDIEWHG